MATVLPSPSLPDPLKDQLRVYRRQFESFGELPLAIEEAGSLMGIRGFKGIVDGTTFAEDVLRIEVPDLRCIEEQTDHDVRTVHSLVDSYVANPRTIILAVVQAGNDIANQPIIQKSRSFDKGGQRTVGIITKPDLINAGTEKPLLTKNRDTTKLKLGFFLVKNSKPTELVNGILSEQWQNSETRYFQSFPWGEQALDMDRVGIGSLRTFMKDNGQRRKIVEPTDDDAASGEEAGDGQILVTESEMKEWVKQVWDQYYFQEPLRGRSPESLSVS